ncbi:hypothetical protein SARC_08154 [Sphaeroforma arctica JP610]|uniref:UBX domain-containing protein n=1 Tax=Sphaeroforma arctica JP610 TaxID=667725 RepID=A0A0L0FRK4_9EUKA|nr:hypothetical protein SARC_08154 [Sphaeroforma arctica JP610]KNC79457.1 hypothetical protein SARC_08154 [Sphaeroforma arctica JP610]|eukprot:XP_014153359.1 hypothetical protein SARC_08154 [Sphaeroforma arctica JP610]
MYLATQYCIMLRAHSSLMYTQYLVKGSCSRMTTFSYPHAECQNHAARTQHTSFSESTEAVKSLTPEEKVARLADLKEIMAEKRKTKEDAERAEAKAREMKRREEGKNIQTAKEYYHNQQAVQAAKEMREAKLADKAARDRVKQEIAKDKAERIARANRNAQPKHTLGDEDRAGTTAEGKAGSDHASTSTTKEYTTCRLQIRLPEGQPIVHTFQATDNLNAVYEFIQSEKPEYAEAPFSLSTTFPRRVFEDADKSKSLVEVALVPSSVLVMARLKNTDDM